MRVIKYLIPFIIFLIIVIFFWQGLKKGDPRKLSSVLIGTSMPTFNYPSLLHPSQTLSNQQFLGHITLLNVWATWCVSCHAEHPVLMDISESKDFVLYGLNYKDDTAKAKDWLNKYGNPYQDVIVDEKGSLAIDFGVYGTPETFIIDPAGIVRYRHVGALTPQVWKKEIEPIVKAMISAQKSQS